MFKQGPSLISIATGNALTIEVLISVSKATENAMVINYQDLYLDLHRLTNTMVIICQSPFNVSIASENALVINNQGPFAVALATENALVISYQP